MIGYVGAPAAEALADPVGAMERGLDARAQRDAIERCARERRLTVVGMVAEHEADPLGSIAERDGVGELLERIREGEAEGIVVASLDRLSPDLVLQELIIAEARRVGCVLVSANDDEAAALAEPPADEMRALVRRAIGETDRFHGDLRALRARLRMRRAAGSDELSTLVEIERMGERGVDLSGIVRALRLRRQRP